MPKSYLLISNLVTRSFLEDIFTYANIINFEETNLRESHYSLLT